MFVCAYVQERGEVRKKEGKGVGDLHGKIREVIMAEIQGVHVLVHFDCRCECTWRQDRKA